MEKVGELSRRAEQAGTWDLIVVDTPPSASALDFLDGPNRLEALAHNPLLRVALGLPRGPFAFLDAGAALATKALDSILGGRLFGDLRTFLRVFERAVLGFEANATQTRTLLKSDRAAFVVVAAPRPTPVGEAVALARRLRHDGLPLRGVVINQVTPVAPTSAEALAAADLHADQAQQQVLAHHRRAQQRRAAERAAGRPLYDIGVPVAEVALAPGGVSDLRSLSELWLGLQQ